MRKRVGIARAIARRPKYISTTSRPRASIRHQCGDRRADVRLRERLGVTSIVITHDMRSAYHVGSRIAMLYEGKVRQVGTVEEIRHTKDRSCASSSKAPGHRLRHRRRLNAFRCERRLPAAIVVHVGRDRARALARELFPRKRWRVVLTHRPKRWEPPFASISSMRR